MMKPKHIAHVCHEANRVIQLTTGDTISPRWDDAPQWQRDSAIVGVEKAIAGETSEQLHDSWCEYKWADGWVYGEVKDGDRKTHPCLIPYTDLPPEQKLKDDLFSAVVTACASYEAATDG